MKLLRSTAVAFALLLALGASLVSQSPSAPRSNAAGNGRFTFALIGDMP